METQNAGVLLELVLIDKVDISAESFLLSTTLKMWLHVNVL